jgi:hypothetical protein
VAAQGHNASARPAHVAEQQLQDAGSAYDLHAGGVLGPAERVGNASGPLPSGVGAEQFRNALKLFRLAAAHLGNDLRRIAGKVPAQNLHNAAWMLQGWVALYVCRAIGRRGVWSAAAFPAVALRGGLICRGLRLRRRLRTVLLRVAICTLVEAPMGLLGIIGVVLLVEAAKQTRKIFGIPKTFVDDVRRIGVCEDVFMKPTVVR